MPQYADTDFDVPVRTSRSECGQTTFGHDTLRLWRAKAIAVFVFLMLTVLVAILAERKLGRMQLRAFRPWLA